MKLLAITLRRSSRGPKPQSTSEGNETHTQINKNKTNSLEMTMASDKQSNTIFSASSNPCKFLIQIKIKIIKKIRKRVKMSTPWTQTTARRIVEKMQLRSKGPYRMTKRARNTDRAISRPQLEYIRESRIK